MATATKEYYFELRRKGFKAYIAFEITKLGRRTPVPVGVGLRA